ncbi:MAG TPA: hypothetical protein VL133_13545, partial [Devosia sp.]|nr:hypothetical protein [Devosia sp.]
MIESSGGFELSALLQRAPDGAWREASSKGMTEINAAGRFLSIAVVDGFEVTLTGMVSGQDGRLTLRRIPTAAITNADSEFAAVFSLDVEIPQVEPTPAADADGAETTVGVDDGCKLVEWRLVNRWNPFSGGLSLDREPYCAE